MRLWKHGKSPLLLNIGKHKMVVSSTALWLVDTDYVTISVDNIKRIAMHYGILFIPPLFTCGEHAVIQINKKTQGTRLN